MFGAAWKLINGTPERTYSRKGQRPQGPRAIMPSEAGLTAHHGSATSHLRNGSQHAGSGAVVTTSAGSSRQLRSASIRTGSTQTEVKQSTEINAQPKTQEHPTTLMQDIIDDSPMAWGKVSSLQSEFEAATKHCNYLTDLAHTYQVAITNLEERIRQEHEHSQETEKNLNRKVENLQHLLGSRVEEVNLLNQDLKRGQHNAIVRENTVASIQKDMAHKERQLNMAKTQICQLQKNLDDCTERIFKMLPFQGVTDEEVSTAYQGLCDSVEAWVGLAFCDVDQALTTMITTMISKDPEYHPGKYIDMQDIQTAQDHPAVEILLLAAFFIRQLYDQMLKPNQVFPGLSDTQNDLLIEVLCGLTQVQPAKDQESIATWRVDLQRSLGMIAPVQAKRAEICHALVTNVADHFKSIMPSDSDSVFHDHECLKIVAAASDLADKMRLSVATYAFHFTNDVQAEQGCIMLKHELNLFDIINAKTGLPLRNGSIIEDEAGRCGEKLRVIRPGMVRKGTGGAADLVLVKPSIIVKFDHEVRRETSKRNKAHT